jgi:hypothetical protein
MTYGLDADGKLTTAMEGSTPIVAGVTYGPDGPTDIDLGSGTDSDQYVYSPATGRMTNFTFYVGTSNLAGTLNWNANGSLGSLKLVNGFNTAYSQTCAFGYDDITRITSDNCGSNWSQNFAYDDYDNLFQTGRQRELHPSGLQHS